MVVDRAGNLGKGDNEGHGLVKARKLELAADCRALLYEGPGGDGGERVGDLLRGESGWHGGSWCAVRAGV